jgi:hypothetical protein
VTWPLVPIKAEALRAALLDDNSLEIGTGNFVAQNREFIETSREFAASCRELPAGYGNSVRFQPPPLCHRTSA